MEAVFAGGTRELEQLAALSEQLKALAQHAEGTEPLCIRAVITFDELPEPSRQKWEERLSKIFVHPEKAGGRPASGTAAQAASIGKKRLESPFRIMSFNQLE